LPIFVKLAFSSGSLYNLRSIWVVWMGECMMWMNLNCDLDEENSIEQFKHDLVNLSSGYCGLSFDFKHLDFDRHKEILKLIPSWFPPHVNILRVDANELLSAKNIPQWQEFIATLPINTLGFHWGNPKSDIQPQHINDFLSFASNAKNIKKIIFPDLSSQNSKELKKQLKKFASITSWNFTIDTEGGALFFLAWLKTKPSIERLRLSTQQFPTPVTVKLIADNWGKEIKELELEHFLGKKFMDAMDVQYSLFTNIPALESLSLAKNELETHELKKLKAFIETLPKNLYHLSLADNFQIQNIEKLKNLFPYLPSGLRVLDLSRNNLSTIDDSFFKNTLRSLDTLNLSATEIPTFSGLPPSVTTLVYAHRTHGDWCTNAIEYEAFLKLIRTIPSSVIKLDLSHNEFGKLTEVQLKQLKEAIPKDIQQVYLGATNLFTDKNLSRLESTVNLLTEDKNKYFYGESSENYVERARKGWKGVDGYPKPPSLAEVDRDKELFMQLTQKVGLAVSEYTAWSVNKTAKRGPEGWFTRWRHGAAGVLRAENLSTTIEGCTRLQDAVERINEFLKNKHTRYHNHSFACFLLDQLTTLKEMEWYERCAAEYPHYKPYPLATLNQG